MVSDWYGGADVPAVGKLVFLSTDILKSYCWT